MVLGVMVLAVAAVNAPYPDVSLGPYKSLLNMFITTARQQAHKLDTSKKVSHSAAQGYWLQAVGEVLYESRDAGFQWRQELIDLGMVEFRELEVSAGRVEQKPGFGLCREWDAFQDGTVNAADTNYAWQSGSVALGCAKFGRALGALGRITEASRVNNFAASLVEVYHDFFTPTDHGGYFWYSATSADNIGVHNTNALLAMASQILADSGLGRRFALRPPMAAKYLWSEMSGSPRKGYTWQYFDKSWRLSPRGEDISHASVTLQFMREAGDRQWWSSAQMRGIATTLLKRIWTGHPSRVAGYVSGSRSTEIKELKLTRVVAIGYAAHGNSRGGDAAVYEYARSILFSSYLAYFAKSFVSGSVDTPQLLAIAFLLTRRPPAFRRGSKWITVAGDPRDTLPKRPGGVRFYTIDWGAPAAFEFSSLVLVGRQPTAVDANILVDIGTNPGRVVVSLVYQTDTDSLVQQWDGARYNTIAKLPAGVSRTGGSQWMRQTFELKSPYFDYQRATGVNVLLQFSGYPVMHMLEATPL